jgi:hypothetical protein
MKCICIGCIYNLYVDAVVLLAQYVHDYGIYYGPGSACFPRKFMYVLCL